jgi:hypothetical protein
LIFRKRDTYIKGENMKIENLNTPSNLPSFRGTYINMLSLHNYGITQNDKKCIIKALKEKNTPLRKFISEIINTKSFENDMGDCFISFNQKQDYLHFSDMIHFSFPKKHQQAVKHTHNLFESDEFKTIKSYKEEMVSYIAEKTSLKTRFIGFNIDKKRGVEKLAEYIQSSKIVEDLKKHIEEYRHRYII